MNQETANRTVDTLIRRTKNGEIQWKHPDEEKKYQESMFPNALYCHFKTGYFYLEPNLSEFVSLYSLYAQPQKGGRRTKLPATDGKISRLVNAIQDQDSELEQFLDDFNAS